MRAWPLLAAAVIAGIAIALSPWAAQSEVRTPITTGDRPHTISGVAAGPQITSLPIKATSSTTNVIFAITVGPVDPGDLVRVYADAEITNDTGINTSRQITGTQYTVGVGWDVAYSTVGGTPVRIGTPLGQNCTVTTHHLVLNIARMLKVPATWTPGAEMVVMFRAGAYASKWAVNGGKDVLKVEKYGTILFDVWAEA
jgi:hypothetical protein